LAGQPDARSPPDAATVRQVHIREVIREFPAVELDLAGLSDAELRQKVEREVDERIQEWKQATKKTAVVFNRRQRRERRLKNS
jgi:hypothetical protein